MFIGEYQHSIDVKGRMAMPVKFRAKLSGGAVVTRGLDNCLFVYSAEEWDKLAQKLASLPLSKANARAFARLMLAGAMQVDIDRQGRIKLPKYLQDYAQLSKEAVVAGLYNRIELWNTDSWKEYKEKAMSGSSEIIEELGELGV